MAVKTYSTVGHKLHQRTKERLGSLLSLDLGYLAVCLESELIEKPDSLFVNGDKEGLFPLIANLSTVLVKEFIQRPRHQAVGLQEKDELVELICNSIFKALMELKPDEKSTIEELYKCGADNQMRETIVACIEEFKVAMKENLLEICKLP